MEIWKVFRHKVDAKHPYASVWEVSSEGRIRRDGVIITPSVSSWGYLTISFGCIHKIVAEAFLPKTSEDVLLGRTLVDHIDGNKLNNNVSNLRWCTHRENVSFPLARKWQYISAKNNGFKGRPPKKPVLQYTVDGMFVKEYPSVLQAGQHCNIWKGGISSVLNGKQKTAGGFVWKYKESV